MTSPRLVKGGLVQVDPASGRMLRVIALQYNPDTLTRTLQVQASGAEGGDRSPGAAAAGRRGRDDQGRGRDRRHRPARATPTSNAGTVELGIHPQLAALEPLVNPTRRRRSQANDALAASGVLEVLPLEAPLTLFVWGKQRVVPVRVTDLSITEEAFDVRAQPDPGQGQPRPAGAVGRRPRLRPPRRHLFMGYLRTQEATGRAGRHRSPSPRSGWRGSDDAPTRIQALLAAGVVPTTSLPADQPLRRASASTPTRPTPAPGEDAVPVPFLRRRLVPAARAVRAALRVLACVEGDRRDLIAAAPPRRRRAVVAARRRQRRHRPARG